MRQDNAREAAVRISITNEYLVSQGPESSWSRIRGGYDVGITEIFFSSNGQWENRIVAMEAIGIKKGKGAANMCV